jgi:hypothetical protein
MNELVYQRKTNELELKATGMEAVGQPSFPFVHEFWESHRTKQSLEYNQTPAAHRIDDNINLLTRFHSLVALSKALTFKNKIKNSEKSFLA